MLKQSDQMTRCVETCLSCYKACLAGALGHDEAAEGAQLGARHVRLLIACAEMCRACAHIILTETPMHVSSCRACADLCAACAIDCERVPSMKDCAAICRQCAEECRRMAG